MITVQVKTLETKEKHIPAIYRLRNSNVRALFFEKALGLILVDNDSKRVGDDSKTNCTLKSTIQLNRGNMTMTKRQNEIVRFAISYLMANLDDAFADYDEESEVLTDGFKPTFQELDDIHTELVTQNQKSSELA